MNDENALLEHVFGTSFARALAWCTEIPGYTPSSDDAGDDLDDYIATLSPNEQQEIHALAETMVEGVDFEIVYHPATDNHLPDTENMVLDDAAEHRNE